MHDQDKAMKVNALSDQVWAILREHRGLISAMSDGWVPSAGTDGVKVLQAMACFVCGKFLLDDAEIEAIEDTTP